MPAGTLGNRQQGGFIPSIRPLLPTATICIAAVWAVYRSSPKILAEEFLEYTIRWPLLDAPEGTDFIYSSPTGMLLFHVSGADGRMSYVVLHAVAMVVGVAGLAVWTTMHVGVGNRARAIRFIVLSPLIAVLLQNVGGYDPFTLLGIVVVPFAWSLRSLWLFTAGTIYLGFQHFEQAVVLSVVWWLTYQALEPRLPGRLRGLRSPLWILPGVFIGKGILTVVLASAGGQPLGTRGAAFVDWAGIGVSIGVNRFPMTLWGGFAGLWLVLIYVVHGSQHAAKWRLVAAVCIALAFSLTTIDNLRVFVMLTVPVATLLIVIANTDSTLSKGVWGRVTEGLMWLGLPQPTSTYALNDLHNFILRFRSLGN